MSKRVSTTHLVDPRLKQIVQAKWADFLEGKYGKYRGQYLQKDGWHIYKAYLESYYTSSNDEDGDVVYLWRMMREVHIEYLRINVIVIE